MEEQGLVVVKDNFLTRISNLFKSFFSRKGIEDFYEDESKLEVEFIESNMAFVQEEIVLARKAFRRYIINNTKELPETILSLALEQVNNNKEQINKIIEINNDTITFDDILYIFEVEKGKINEYKLKNKKNNCYQVPVGVMGVVCTTVEQCIKNMIRAIVTRNSIIILQEKNNKYSTQSLILLIFKECLKNLGIDDNIIQLKETQEIDISKFDRFIDSNANLTEKETQKSIYFYQEDDCYEDDISYEVDKIKNLEKYKDFNVSVIKGEFGDVVEFLNNNKCYAVCMYTNNQQRAYKFMNWINTNNLFINTGLINCKNDLNCDNKYYEWKNVCHENIFS